MSFSAWKTSKLGDICDITSSKRIYASEYCETGIPFFRGKEIIEKFRDQAVSTELFITFERYAELNNKFGSPTFGDILLTSVGTLGVPYFVLNETFYFKDGNLTWFRNFRECNSKFIFLWLQSPQSQNQILGKSIGSTQKALTIDILKKFDINLPPLNEQKTIMSILSSIDEKIKINNRINDNLAAMAQTIFQERYNPFGDLPLGWRIGKLNELCSYNPQRIAIKSLSLCTYISTENMLSNKAGFVNAAGLPSVSQTTKFENGYILVSNIRPYFKKIVYCDFSGGCSADVLCFKPNVSMLSSLLYCILYSDRFFDYMMAGSKGTKMPRGDKQQIMDYPVVIPTEEVFEDAAQLISPILSNISQVVKENLRLTELRDTLLPKLMSGEIDVSEITN